MIRKDLVLFVHKFHLNDHYEEKIVYKLVTSVYNKSYGKLFFFYSFDGLCNLSQCFCVCICLSVCVYVCMCVRACVCIVCE